MTIIILFVLFQIVPIDTITIKNVVEIGASSDEYQLVSTSFVSTTPNNDIVITDRRTNLISIINYQGDIIQEFGGRGRGPGEFTEITSVEHLPDGRLLVYDRMSRRFSKIKLGDGSFETTPIDTKTIFSIWEMQYYGNSILARFEDVSGNPYQPLKSDFLLHYTDNLFKSIKNSIISIDQLTGNSKFEKQIITSPRGFRYLKMNNNIWISPFVYRGFLYNFNSDGELIGKIKGYKNIEKPFEELEEDEASNFTRVYRSFGSEGRFFNIVNSQSVGLIEYKNHILHFSTFWENDTPKIVLDIFDKSGTLKNSFTIKNALSVANTSSSIPFKIMHSSENKIYAIDSSVNTNLLKVFELDF
ncbi:MAG: 6-bladed beta-propeller [Balneola sp.]|jgi:hypothetical protein